MAEVLFRSITNGPGANHWKLGDIVAVRDDGWTWGRLETRAAWVAAGGIAEEWPGGFFLLKIPGVSVTTIEYMISLFPEATDIQGARRLWRFDVASLTQNQLNSLLAKTEFTTDVDLTSQQAKDKIRRKDTNAAATW